MEWQKALYWVVGLGVLYLLVRALRGLGTTQTRDEKDSDHRWLHADATPPKPAQDAPVTNNNGPDATDDSGAEGDSDQ